MSAFDGSEMDGDEALVSELRASPPVAPERLRQRVLESAPATRAPRSRKRKLVLVVVPAAIVLAVGAALVHGFVSSGSHPAAASAQSQKVHLIQGGVTGNGVERKAAHSQAPTGTTPESAVHGQFQSESKLPQSYNSVASAPKALAGVLLRPGRGAVTIPRNRLVHA